MNILCSRCTKKAETKRGHPITDKRDCENCEGLEDCTYWLWGGNKPSDTKEKAEDCPYFSRIGTHTNKTCRRGDI